MWVWSVRGAADIRALVGHVAEHRVTDVWLSVPLGGADPAIAAVATRLRAAGVEVACLGGDPAWAERPADAVRWAVDAVGADVFDRIHLDVEPWVRDDWASAQERLIRGHRDMVDQVADATGVPVDVDMPAWAAHRDIDDGDYLTLIAAGASRVALMAYRDRAEGLDGILAYAGPGRRRLTAADREYWVGIDTVPPTSPADRNHTFADDGPVAMDREVRLVDAGLRGDPRYRGVAVHDWRWWSRLKSR
ncbi:hypothetical protein D7316_01569 [Gordonia insulae]|uniref:Uncharacterized protein n=2 Tax=Gordonia insulae TaxID=2420509 RepID=A0A3G8JIR6_9ACTN|nr:hypothetical protein D7316_01569 [Gordonia insulae]